MRILLTGGSGMVGRNLLEHPEISDFEILHPTSKELNLLNYDAIKEYLLHYKPEMIIHTAGRVGGIQANICEPVKFLLDNMDMGRNLVWAARKAEIKKLINISSSCAYPCDGPNPLKEELILTGKLEPTNEAYALAKVVTLRLCEYIKRENSTYQYKTLIPCNMYGRWDKFGPENSHLIPAIIYKVHLAKKQGQNKVDIWGDGTARREFMYAGEFADCLVHAVRKFESLPDLINVGLGRDYTVNQYYKAVAEVVGFQGEFEHDLSKPVGMKQKLVDISKQKKWGWQVKINLQEGILKTYKFYLEQKDGVACD